MSELYIKKVKIKDLEQQRDRTRIRYQDLIRKEEAKLNKE